MQDTIYNFAFVFKNRAGDTLVKAWSVMGYNDPSDEYYKLIKVRALKEVCEVVDYSETELYIWDCTKTYVGGNT